MKNARKITKKTINITAKDIEKGIAGNSESCPIALALKRTFKDIKWISVGYQCVNFYTKGYIMVSYISDTPTDARSFMRKFDKNKNIEPAKLTFHFHSPR